MDVRSGVDDGENGTGSDALALERLDRELAGSDLAKHLAFFYRSPETQLKVAATFVRRGLRAGHRCLYYYDENTRDRVVTALESAGVDVAARVAADDLLVREGREAYAESDFDPDALAASLEDGSRESVADGYEGLWVAGEVSWCFHTDMSYDHVVGFEADFDALSRDLPVVALCQYDLNRFDEESVAKALWTHRQVVYRYSLCENPYYIPPDEFDAKTARPPNSQLMLDQLQGLSRAHRDAERREQRLSVVNRILRHNVRNDLNVIQGVLKMLRDPAVEADLQEPLSTAITKADEVVEIATKGRFVEETLERGVVDRVELAAALERVVDEVASVYPDGEVTVTGDTDIAVVADRNIGTALAELAVYALGQQERAPPRVTLSVTSESVKRASVEVRYPGGPVPASDREVLEEGLETQLNHCQGLGLWLAKWIVDNGDGQLAFPTTGDPQIRVEFVRLDPDEGP